MATDSRLSKEVLRNKSTACLNFIIRLYSLGVSPVCCLNFRSKWRWHRQVSSANRRSDKSPFASVDLLYGEQHAPFCFWTVSA